MRHIEGEVLAVDVGLERIVRAVSLGRGRGRDGVAAVLQILEGNDTVEVGIAEFLGSAIDRIAATDERRAALIDGIQ